MNIAAAAAISSTLASASPRKASHSSLCTLQLHGVPILLSKKRVLINVRGREYETYQSTLDQYPGTLLGSEMGRAAFYDPERDALVLDRNPTVFDSILFFYQSKGILARPDDVSECLFKEEVQFYGIDGLVNPEEEENTETDTNESRTERRGNTPTCACEKRLRENIWKALEYPTTSSAATAWAYLSVAVIVFSVTIFCLETTPLMCESTNNTRTTPTADICLSDSTMYSVEQAVVIFFTVEYLLRLYTAPRKLKFIRSVLALVDLAAIMPYYVTLIFGFDKLPPFSVLRLCRVIRLMKLSRYSSGLKLIGKTLSDSCKIMGSLMASVLMTVVFFASVEYYLENSPSTNFGSIPEGFWWAIITMTTVGYGDMVPVTFLGKVASAFCAISGIIFLYILPLPAFVMSFSKRYEESLKKEGKGSTHTRETAITPRTNTWPSHAS